MKNKTEFKIGEEIQFGLQTLVCKEDTDNTGCEECLFYDIWIGIGCEYITNHYLGNCAKESRTDNTNIIFKRKEE